MSCWEEGVSIQWVDRVKTIAMEDEGLARYSAMQEAFSKQQEMYKTGCVEEDNSRWQENCQTSQGEEDSSSQQGDRIKTNIQQRKYKSSCGEEDRIKTT